MRRSLGYHRRQRLVRARRAYGNDLSVNPGTGMVADFMVKCSGGDQWAARDVFLDVPFPFVATRLPNGNTLISGGNGDGDPTGF